MNVRRGFHHNAGGFTWTTRRFSLLVSLRPRDEGRRWQRYGDVAGYRGWYVGRLLVAYLTPRTWRRRWDYVPMELRDTYTRGAPRP